MRSVRLFRNEKAAGMAMPLWHQSWCHILGKRSLVTNKVENLEPDPYEGNYNFVDCDQYAKVTVIGAAGRVGRTLSLLLKTCPLIDHLCLFDTDKSVKGIGVDISHIDTKCSVNHVCGMRNIHQALDAPDVVVISAGSPVSPELSRDQLFERNAPVVAGLSEACARFCPKACVVLITNPINSLLPVMGEVYQLINNRIPFRKLFGLTTLDVVRANTFVAEVVRKDPNSIIVPVVGGASQDTIVPVISQMKPCCKIKHGEQLALTECIKRAEENLSDCQNCGTRGASSLSTAYAAFRFTSSLVMALKGAEDIIECAYVKSDIIPELEYLASPLKLGIRGVEYNFGYPHLSDYEVNLMEQAAVALINDVDMGKCFVVEHQEKQKKFFKRCSSGRLVTFLKELFEAHENQCHVNDSSAGTKKKKCSSPENSKRRNVIKTTDAKHSDARRSCLVPVSKKYSIEENYIQSIPLSCIADQEEFKDVLEWVDSAEDQDSIKESMQDQEESSPNARSSSHECRNIKNHKVCEKLINFMTKAIEKNEGRPQTPQNSKKRDEPPVKSSDKWMASKFETCVCPREQVISENIINSEDKPGIAEPIIKNLKEQSCEKEQQIQEISEIETYEKKAVESECQITPKCSQIPENQFNQTPDSFEEKTTQSYASCEQPQYYENVQEPDMAIKPVPEIGDSKMSPAIESEKRMKSKPQVYKSIREICENKLNLEKVCKRERTPTEVEYDIQVNTREAPSTEEETPNKPKQQFYRRCKYTYSCPKFPAKTGNNRNFGPRERMFWTSVHVKEIEGSIQDPENRTPDSKNNYRCRIKIEKKMKN